MSRGSGCGYILYTCMLKRCALQQQHCLNLNPAWPSPHLGVGHIHASGIQPVLYLLCIVDLQKVITTKLHICQLLVVFKEVNGEGHLAGCAGCCGEQHRLPESTDKCRLAHLCAHSIGRTLPAQPTHTCSKLSRQTLDYNVCISMMPTCG